MQKAPLRSEIEKALDELERYEEGMRFQSLAVVLAKQRWPELVAAERKKDLGLDAFVKRAAASDGVGRGLASSITAEYKKIEADATKVADNFGSEIQQLIFATSGRVGTTKKIEWARQVHQKFGFELVVLSREDIITSLTAPANVGLCRTYLRIDVEIEPTITTVVARVRSAARDEAANWARQVAGRPLIRLQASRVESNGAHGDTIWSLQEIEAALRDARRLVLEAPAGRGKTTTLIQLATGPLSIDGSVFFIDLPSWVKTGQPILSFIAGMPAFQRQGLESNQLAQAEPVERFYFLLNGWNEITESSSKDAVLAIKDLERQFPSTGILVATRAHHVSPPLPGSVQLRLRRVTRQMRTKYVRERLGERAPKLLQAIDADAALEQLTKTPFVLSLVTTIVDAGEEIPRSRVRVMDAVIRLLEKSPEHQADLKSPPVRGMSEEYLRALGVKMVQGDTISISDSDARAIISKVSTLLIANGQTNTAPAPSEVLNVLCGHHLLERIEYPAVAYRFEHQLFQEYYASRALHRTFLGLLAGKPGDDGEQSFLRQYVNEPAWAEPLRMVAESVRVDAGSLAEAKPDVAARLLVDIGLAVDPIFAAELSNVLGVTADSPVAVDLSRRLRAWYNSSDIHHRNCAFTGMLASGLGTFRDIVEPLLASVDRQIRLRSNRLWPEFHVSSLGEKWQEVMSNWPEQARADLVSEVLYSQFVPEVSAFALADPSTTVRVAAMDALNWVGAEEAFNQAANEIDDHDLTLLILRVPASHFPASLLERSRRVLTENLEQQAEPVKRMRTLLKLHELKDSKAVPELQKELDQYVMNDGPKSSEQVHLLEAALDAVRESEPAWVSEWVAKGIADGELWADQWQRFVTTVPEQLRDEQFQRVTTQPLEHRKLEGAVMIVVHDKDPTIAQRAFAGLLDIQTKIGGISDRRATVEWDIHHQIETLLRAISPSVILDALTETLTRNPELPAVSALLYTYGQIGATFFNASELNPEARELLKDYLLRSGELILSAEDPGGGLKAAFASLLSQVGEPGDINTILANMEADLKRVRSGRQARARGERSTLADSSTISQAHSYVRSVVTLLADDADKVLIKLLQEPEYEVAVIEELGRQFDQPWTRGFGRKKPYEQIWTARTSGTVAPSDNARRSCVTAAIRDRMRQLEETRIDEPQSSHALNIRLKKLALGLAQTAPNEFAELILETMSLPAEFDAWMRVDALERLLFSGALLPAPKCLRLLDASIEHMSKWGIQDQDRWLLIRYLAVCPYVSPQSEGLVKIRDITSRVHFSIYDFRDLLKSLGYSRFEGALTLMQEIVDSQENWRAIQYEWIDALTTLDIEAARTLVLGFVDPQLAGLPFAIESGPSDRIAARIAAIAAQDVAVDQRLRSLSLFSLDDSKRHLLAKSLAARGTPEATLAVLNLIDDKAGDRIPWEVRRFLEQTFVRREPYQGAQDVFTLKAAASNSVRRRLFEMVFSDEQRKRSAYSLLGEIEEWRVEHGRPIDEPRHPAVESGRPWPPPEPT